MAKVYQANEIKNIAMLGGSGSGKTTLMESMLFESGVIKRRGSIETQSTVCDYFPVEKEYGYSVFSTVCNVEFMGKKLNIIDCAGSDDFCGGTVAALQMVGSALVVLSANEGVTVGTQNNFRLVENAHKPLAFVVNKCDHEYADFEKVLHELRETFGNRCTVMQYPVNAGTGFNAVIDVLKGKMLVWGPDGGAPEEKEIPAGEQPKVEEMRQALQEQAAEADETLLDKFLEEGLNDEEIMQGLKSVYAQGSMYPVICCSAAKDMGIRRLMDFLNVMAPAPRQFEYKTVDGKSVRPVDDAPTSLYVFKTSVEPHVGEVSYFRVMQGVVRPGDDLQNMERGSKERISQLFMVDGSMRTPVEEVHAGDIAATVKLKDTRTGNTLNGKDCDNRFDFIKFPNSKYSRAIKAVNEAETEKMMNALQKMREEDPTWQIEQSKELKQIIVHGQGEFHLRTLKWRMENNEKIQIVFDEPKVPYRETITKAARADYRHKKQSGGAGQFGEVHLIVEPYYEGMPAPEVYRFGGQEFRINAKSTETVDLEWGGKLVFINSVVGGAIDTRFMPAILKGVMQRMEQGPLTGCYARDVRVIVYDGKMHPVDSNELSFMLAGRQAFAQAFRDAGPKILEPIYDVEVFVPSDKMGDVMGDLQGRRAMIMGMTSENGYEKIVAKAPQKEMLNYSTALSSITGGRASFIMKFASYELVPGDVQSKLIAEYEASQQD